MATVIAEVRNSGMFRTRRMPIFQMTAGQGRAKLKCIWFNATYLRDRFKPGQMIALYGKVEQDHYGGRNSDWCSRSSKSWASAEEQRKTRKPRRKLRWRSGESFLFMSRPGRDG